MGNGLSFDNQLITILLCPQAMSCAVIERASTGTPFELTAFERFNFAHLEFETSIMFNPTRISKYLYTFVKKNNIAHPYVVFAVQGPRIFEKYVELTVRAAQPSYFVSADVKGLVWDYRYVYPTEHGHSVFYVAGIPHELIMQYQLCGITADLNVIAMIPASFALLHVYRYLHGAAFRRTQLAIDMLQHHNMIEYICTQDVFSRLVRVSGTVSIHPMGDIRSVLIACGVLMSEGMTHEKY